MIRWLCLKTGRRFWYSIQVEYMVDNKSQFGFFCSVGLYSKSSILSNRIIGKIVHNRIYNQATRKYLKNGDLSINVNGYLGWIKDGK